MASNIENSWLGNLERQAGIRRILLIHGDVFDVRFSQDTQDYCSAVDLVVRVLKRRGFDQVVLWDRFAGADSTVGLGCPCQGGDIRPGSPDDRFVRLRRGSGRTNSTCNDVRRCSSQRR